MPSVTVIGISVVSCVVSSVVVLTVVVVRTGVNAENIKPVLAEMLVFVWIMLM